MLLLCSFIVLRTVKIKKIKNFLTRYDTFKQEGCHSGFYYDLVFFPHIETWYIFIITANNTTEQIKELNYMMLDKIALIILVIGGLNWGSIGLFQFDLVSWLCGGQDAILSRIIYTLVALSAIWCISLLFRENEVLAVSDSEE